MTFTPPARVKIALNLLAAIVAAGLCMGGCASRADQLRHKADVVERELLRERDRVLGLPDTQPERAPRIKNLSVLRGSLSAATLGITTVKVWVPADQRELAYDVLDEALDTIRWNIPLGPNDPKKVLPAALAPDGRLRLDAIRPPATDAPSGSSPGVP
jgi:hypothetical protein